ncbi:helicase-exonuclease AddAB subunit AddB [Paenibacillus albicereus]|uniref:ATP-dependent helicase/deoxyribonuclease subunit B n=1 Tax=Paenibacillus albicereus TaxID=2726185 RepID=A0A6H2GYU2_9BACL|nr:helicase-exonuclease AddAB subunit AddB [Paenibacillus albicereus]QJC52562.1 helicase-exonuclease AddAB subunit AddB [Paenibacillus albicereus]
MALRFIIGRAGTGKTHACMEEIRRELSADPAGAPLVLLTPEQATFQTEYALLGSGIRSSLRAQVLSFRRLALRVMQESGGAALVPVGENGKNMLLHKIVHRLSPQLRLFQAGSGQQGFIAKMGELLTEWKRYGIDAAAVRGSLGGETGPDPAHSIAGSRAPGPLLERKLHDLSLIYAELERELAGHYMDDEDHLTLLADGYADCRSMRGARYWLDGFNGFTARELAAVGSLLRHAESVTVTLCLDRLYEAGERPHELDLFHPAADACIRLTQLAAELGAAVESPLVLPPGDAPRYRPGGMLEHLNRHFGGRVQLRTAAGPSGSGSDRLAENAAEIVLRPSASRRAEVEAAARDMVRQVRERGMRWRELAVVVRQTADYSDMIQQVFTDYGIPFFLDGRRDVLHHPLVEFIRSALETVLYGWKHEAVFRCVKTELLFPADGRLDRERFDRLENYVLAAGIEGRGWKSLKRWQPLRTGSVEDEPGEAGARQREEFEDVLRSRSELMRPLTRFERAMAKAETVRQRCEALFDLLDRSGTADRLERRAEQELAAGRPGAARVHRQVWDGVLGLLDQLVELAGEEPIPADLFAGMVETGLESMKLSAVPPSLDQVVVGAMDRVRNGRVRAAYVLGASDGVLPMRIQEDGLLTEREREQLGDAGLEMAPGVRRRLLDERFHIYRAFLAPSERLWVSWPLADEEGKGLHPSEYIRHLQTLFPGLAARAAAAAPDAASAAERQLDYLELPQRALSYLVPRLREWLDGGKLDPLWQDVYNWFAVRPDWQGRLTAMTGALGYDNQVVRLGRGLADRLYGGQLTTSVSRMERFVSCPFQHFAAHGLKLKERRLYRLGAPDMGQLFHAALTKVATELGEGWGRAGEARIRETASLAVEELVPRLQSEILLSSSRYRYIAGKLKAVVSRAAIVLGEHARRADFRPIGLEVQFGPGGELPPLDVEFPDGSGSVTLIGRIDRVDAARSDKGLLLRVLDYKSSATQLRLEEVASGLSLQMLAYLDVLLTHAESWLGERAHPAGVLYFHVQNPVLSVPAGMEAEEAAAMLLKRFKMRGLLLDDADTVRMMDAGLEGRSDLLPAGFRKDGGFLSDSSVASGRQWELLRRSVRRTIGGIGQSVKDGEIAIRPYRLGAKTPCQFCAYKPVCQFDPLNEGNAYLKLPAPGKEEFWTSLEELAEAQAEPAASSEHPPRLMPAGPEEAPGRARNQGTGNAAGKERRNEDERRP